MKKQLLALVGLGLMLATISAYAQTGVKANIPFNFVVDKATLPAGEYIVQSVSTSGRAMSIHSADRKFTRAAAAASLLIGEGSGENQNGVPPLR